MKKNEENALRLTTQKPKSNESNFKVHQRKPLFEEGDLLIHQQFTHYGTNAKEWMRKCVLLLPEIEKREIWQKKGFSCIYEYAAKLAGMSHAQVDNALWVLNKIKNRSELMKVVEEKGINAVRPIVALSTESNDKFLAEKARTMSMHELEVFARDIKRGNCNEDISEKLQVNFLRAQKPQPGKITISMSLDPKTAQGTAIQPERVIISMSLDPEVAKELEKLNGKGDWNELMKEFLKLRKEKLEEKKPEPVVTDSRHVPAKIQKFVIEKTRGKCAFPSCSREVEHLHHTDRFALKKVHDPDSIVPLCSAHHAIAHQGLIENENLDPKFWKIQPKPNWTDLKFKIDQKVLGYKTAMAGA